MESPSMKNMNLTKARNSLFELAKKMERDPALIVQVVKRGRHVMTMMPAELYESMLETLEMLSDEEAVPRLRRALQEIEKGKGVPWEVAKRRLGRKG
jgi:PHD/YefM family antitoxin component YafN of YafNO toxin-antitoxin module